MDIRFRWIGLVALVLSIGLTLLIRWAGLKLKLVDEPGGRKAHQSPTPFTGGIAIFLAFMIPSLLTIRSDAPVAGVLLPAALIFLMGLVDDVWGLPAWFRLLGQMGAALLLVANGIHVKVFPQLWHGIPLDGLNVALTVFGVVGVTNALNFLDNMDGLAAGLVCTSCLAFFAVAWWTGQRWLGVYAAALMGSCIGFLLFNVRPASIFMGDSGSTFLGFCLAALAVMGEWSRSTIVACCIPVTALSILIFDTTLTTILRIQTGKVRTLKEWIVYAGQDHLSHRMAEITGDPGKAVLMIHAMGGVLSVIAFLLVGANAVVATGVMGMLAVFYVIWFLLIQDVPDPSHDVGGGASEFREKA